MSLICPKCRKPELKIKCGLELGPDGYNDEISIQAIYCNECGFVGAAVYVECKRGRGERWSHVGVGLANNESKKIIELIERCPDPNNGKCNCEAHRYFNVENEYGSRDPLLNVNFEDESGFNIEIQ